MSKPAFVTIFSIPALFIALLIFFVGNTVMNRNNTDVVVKISPTDAILSINGSRYQVNELRDSIVGVPIGEQTIRVEREGFQAEEFVQDLQGSDDQILSSLTPLTDSARAFLSTDFETLAREEVEGLLVTDDRFQSSEEISRISLELPYVTQDYRIDIGAARTDTNAELSVYITANEPTYYENARRWMLFQGFTPSDYAYIYRTFAEAGIEDQQPTREVDNSQSLRFEE